MPSLANFLLVWGQVAVPVEDNAAGLTVGNQSAIILGTVVASFILGHFLARALRMPEYNLKIGLVLATLLGAISIIIVRWPPKLGIDLSGGVVLVYEIDENQAQESTRGQALDMLNRGLGTVENQRLTAGLNAQNQIEIPLPSREAAAAARKAVDRLNKRGLGIKEAGLRMVDGKPVLVYESPRQEQVADREKLMERLVGAVSKRINPNGLKEVTVRQYGAEQIEIIVPEVEAREVEAIKRIISTSGNLQFRILANSHDPDQREIIELAQQTPSDEVYQGGKLKARWIEMRERVNPQSGVLRNRKNAEPLVLILMDDYNVDGDNLSSATPGVDERGNVCINFSFDAKGAVKFGQLTTENEPNKRTGLAHELGIVLDNVLQSAASIRTKISDRGQITGSFDEQYVEFVVNVLNSGSLPAALQKKPISEEKIGAQLGADTIKSGRDAMVISTIAVVVFMLVYYRFAGAVADVAVVMNMILAVALMMLFKAAFTLPGLAGLVLTVGMAVDANVLIYERMREEAARGASLRMTIRNGFSRAMSTIIDSNLTTVSSAVVLFIIGTDQIKGFAISLILGLVVSLYTAVYVARVIFDVFERKRWITRLRMMQFVGETHFDFVRWRGPAIAASLVVLAICAVAVAERGKGLFDIDFTGGTSVQLLFKPDHEEDIAEVRRKIADLPNLGDKDISVSSVGEHNLAYKIDTSERDIQVVQQELKKAFGDDLATYAMSYKEIAPVATSAGGQAAPAAAGAGTEKPVSENPPAEKPRNENPAAPSAKADTGEPSANPAPAPSAGEKAAEEGNAEPAGDKPANPAPNKSGGVERGPASVRVGTAALGARGAVALAGGQELEGLILAQAADAAKTAQASAAGDSATNEGSQEAAPGDKAAASATSGEAKATGASAESASKTAGETQPGEGETATGEAATAEIGVPVTSVAELHFEQEINRPTLARLIEENLEAAKLPLQTRFELTNPKALPGDNHNYADWKLSIQLPSAETDRLLKQTQVRLADTPVFPSSSSIGGKVAGQTQWLALEALLASMVVIVLYIWVRFQSIMFGLACVLALIHDVLVAVGFLALSAYLAPYLGWALVDPFKISLAVVAALLTIAGYSCNDTIVIFDRIREIRGKNPDLTGKMINDSVNQTLGRTLLTSGTVFIGTLILYIVGGPGIHPFAYAMLVGLISGTYSTVYIASPVLLWLKRPMPAGSRSAAQPSHAR